MPAEQAVHGELFVVMLGGVKHHFHDAVHVPVHIGHTGNRQSQTLRKGGGHLFRVQHLTFDLAGAQHIHRQGCEVGLTAHIEAHCGHLAEKVRLCMACLYQCRSQCLSIPRECRPRFAVMDVGRHRIPP